ncbi:4Fe-4S ferredoxin [Denitratisoma oestradiolicum]|uniref:4Fe-4S ferredoxin n=2 Tax=Denitratisoma oestradiolicum TaxID=311182 RepID=A0A6S6XUI3_9PROT|nr:4Fe-4S ferredoxin [Denitratisoma oestradiolicum]
MRWGMTIDLQRCTGCYGCVMACKQEHSTPSGVHFRRMMFEEVGEYPKAKRIHAPVQCNHCAEPPCVPVCPTKATYKRDDGLVLVDADVCIGCGYCMTSCPYEQRHFVGDKLEHFEDGLTPHELKGGEAGHDWDSKRDTVVKCTFCQHRLDKAKDTGLTPGVDREVTPACVNTCPSNAMEFGDLDDPNSKISRLIEARKGFPLLPGAGTKPSIFYLPGDTPLAND